MHHHKYVFLVLFLLCTCFIACDSTLLNQKIDEGTIVYNITYPDLEDNSYLLGILPGQMTTTFTEDGFRTDVEASMGVFKTSIISKAEDKKIVHSVKLLDKKFASHLGKDDILKINPSGNNIEFKPTGNTKKIAGYDCIELTATAATADSVWRYKVYYTDEIKISKPNRLTPFESIDGVLMEYEAINYETLMHFKAQKVIEEKIDQKVLELGSDYTMIQPDTLRAEMMAIFSMVK